MANGLAEIRRGPGLKDRHLGPTAGIRKHKLALDDRFFYDNFKGVPQCSCDDGGGIATTTGVNLMNTGKNLFEYRMIGTQTVVFPSVGTGGLDFKLDDGAAGGDGAEVGLGITAQSRAAYTVGTDAFYLKFKFLVTDQSGMLTFYTGFRLAEAYQDAVASYDTYGCIGLNRVNASASADIKIASELDGDASAVVDTTDNYTEATNLTLGVYVDLGGNFTYSINGAAPTVTKALKATAGDVLVPFIHFVDHTDTPGATLFKEFECGLLDANVR
jgi:hypothetical protein